MKQPAQSPVYVSIPAYNEATIISRVIAEIKQAGYPNIVVVDDGSTDDTYQQAVTAGVIAVRHKLNRGKGAATKTGIEAAKQLGAGIIVTMDADGQHDPHNIPALISPLLEGKAAISLGIRQYNARVMPRYKITQNRVANFFTWLLYGIKVRDSQSGFRAYSREATQLIQTSADRYEFESEVVGRINAHRLPYVEVPITVRYTTYSMTKVSRQSLVNGIKTLYRMLWNLIS